MCEGKHLLSCSREVDEFFNSYFYKNILWGLQLKASLRCYR